jgi:hypothetical protein
MVFGSVWWRVGLAGAALALLAAATAAPAQGREPRAHGQRLVAEYRLPPDAIARYAAMAAGALRDTESREHSRFADRLPWVGPAQQAGAGRNPYRLVFTAVGVARGAGQVVAHWQAGWEVHESADASREVLMAVPAIARTAIAPGQSLTLSATSRPVSFRGERPVAPMLGLVQARNLDIHEVQVQVWSGQAPLDWPRLAQPSAAPLLAAAACLLGWIALLYWRHTRAVPPIDEASHPAAVGREVPEPPQTDPASLSPEDLVPLQPSHRYRVQSALQQLLTVGLVVETVPDPSRPEGRPRQPRQP